MSHFHFYSSSLLHSHQLKRYKSSTEFQTGKTSTVWEAAREIDVTSEVAPPFYLDVCLLALNVTHLMKEFLQNNSDVEGKLEICRTSQTSFIAYYQGEHQVAHEGHETLVWQYSGSGEITATAGKPVPLDSGSFFLLKRGDSGLLKVLPNSICFTIQQWIS